ncbi:MFS transporter [Thalassospira marina]
MVAVRNSTVSKMSAGHDKPLEIANWSAIYAMSLCSFVLVASEFMPVSLLSPMASSLALSEGEAGRTIAASGFLAVLTSLSIGRLTRAMSRQNVLLLLTCLLVVSGSRVASAASYPMLMVGRALLGVAIGGFWSMSAAVAMRLVPVRDVPRALAIVNGGNAIAMTVAAPIGSFLGGWIGWRGAFWCLVPLGVLAVVWQICSLPQLPPERKEHAKGVVALLRFPPVLVGLVTVALLFIGQFVLFTYLRPFLEQVTGVSITWLSTLLLVLGASGFVGTILVGRIVAGRVFQLLAILPLVMAVAAFALSGLGASLPFTVCLLAIWGFTATAAPVVWWTWLARTVPENAEAGGGLLVAVIQVAITVGATMGGVIFDALGAVPDFIFSGIILCVAAAAAVFLKRFQTRFARHREIVLKFD